jgi:hypothetical protein
MVLRLTPKPQLGDFCELSRFRRRKVRLGDLTYFALSGARRLIADPPAASKQKRPEGL